MAKIHLKIDDPNHTFIIAEAGSNWKSGSYEEDLEQAKKLIKIASEAGADAVKFQTYKADTVYAYNAGNSNYLTEQGINKEINEIFEYLSMPYEMISELSQICNDEKIIFMSTPLSVEEVAKIATLPTLDEARSIIVGILTAPAKKIMSILLAPGSKIAILAHAKSKKS